MKLRAKFNLILLLVFTIGLSISGYVSYGLLQKNARDETVRNAGLIMDTAIAIRGYTVNQVRPHLAEQSAHTFLPQTVPAYAATETINALREKYPQYSYKEATINPTNPRDRAEGWEWKLVNQLRLQPDQKEQVGEIGSGDERMLYLARPIRITNPACLSCHSDPDQAPASMVSLYGDQNGFGWPLNETIGAQLVTVPMSLPISNANAAFLTFMSALLGIFLVLFVVLNWMLSRMIIRPIIDMSHTADQISVGNFDLAELTETGKDEVALLATSFNRMRRSLLKAMDMVTA